MIRRPAVHALSWVVVPLVLTVVFGGPASAADPPFAHYHYFDRVRPLPLDATRMAVFGVGDESRNQFREIMVKAGWSKADLSPHPMKGWSLFSINSASGAPALSSDPGEAVKNAIDLLRTRDPAQRFYLSPVFDGDFGEILVTPRILLRIHPDVSAGVEDLLLRVEAPPLYRKSFGGMDRAWALSGDLSSGIEVLGIANRLARLEAVEWAEPDMIFSGRSSYIPGDSGFGDAWGLHNTGQSGGTPDVDVDAPEAWESTVGAPGVLTVVLDVGVQQDHPDIHQIAGADFTDGPSPGDGGPANPCDNHGTPVAGVISAVIDGGGAAVGVAPGTRIASARVFKARDVCNGDWLSLSSWTVAALDWAVFLGARVTNNSNGYGFESSAIDAKYAETRKSHEILHFSSAGNGFGASVTYPANLPSVNAVTAVDRNGSRAAFSNRGPEESVSGPGVDVFTTDRTGSAGWTSSSHVFADGTSFASPMAAGAVALLLSRAPLLTADEMQEILEDSAADLGPASWDPDFGWGLVNAAAAVSAIDIFEDDFESGDLSSWNDATP